MCEVDKFSWSGYKHKFLEDQYQKEFEQIHEEIELGYKKAKANVICEVNGSSLETTLEVVGIEPDISPTELCGAEDYSPCCLVQIERA